MLAIFRWYWPQPCSREIAGKLEKPDGFQWLSRAKMSDRLAHPALDDLPGISKAMKMRVSVRASLLLYASATQSSRSLNRIVLPEPVLGMAVISLTANGIL